MYSYIRIMLPLGGALLFAGTAGYIFYHLFKKDDEEEESLLNDKVSSNPLSKLEVKIPRQAVGAVIGRHGSNIKVIQECTSTSIRFRDDDENERSCIIVGKIEKVEKAKEMILKSIDDIPVLQKKEIFVPVRSVGRIIGRQGSSVNAISRSTGAKVQVDSNSNRGFESEENNTHRIVIQGTEVQILAAEEEIMLKVKEDDQNRDKINHSASKISLRLKQRTESTEGDTTCLETRQVVASDSIFNGNVSEEKCTDVFVSAVESPNNFFVQVVGNNTVELDKLVEDMTEYYDEQNNRELHEIEKEVKNGDVVAAKFSKDNCWYRGHIIGVHKHGEPLCKVFFYDFGDCEFVHFNSVCQLRTDYLKLNAQALECRLAGIDPSSAMSQECLNVFEILTYAMGWKPIKMKICGYKVEGQDTLPYVKLIDKGETQEIDVAEELIARDLAKRCSKIIT